jgi:hypothetical protein
LVIGEEEEEMAGLLVIHFDVGCLAFDVGCSRGGFALGLPFALLLLKVILTANHAKKKREDF